MLRSSSKKDSPYGVQSVDRTLAILEAVSESGEGLRPTDIAAQLDLALSTAHRLMAHLAYRGYLEMDRATSRYHLGMKVLLLKSSMLRGANVEDKATPYMREITQLTGEASHLAVYFEGEIVYVRTREGPNTTFGFTPPGKRAPAHATSLGKAMLAHLPPPAYNEVVFKKGLKQITPKTITAPEVLASELDLIRQRGYAVDDEEVEIGVRCVGAPVFDYTGQVVAAMSVAGPGARITPERIPRIGALLCSRCEALSRRLGFSGQYPGS